VPLENREAVLGPVRDHGEVAHTAPGGEELALPCLDPHREVPADTGPILPVVAIARNVHDLGPGSERVRRLPLHLPGRLGEASERGLEGFRHIGTDGVRDRGLGILAPAEDLRLVQRAGGAR
jgi:hypothetical protein